MKLSALVTTCVGTALITAGCGSASAPLTPTNSAPIQTCTVIGDSNVVIQVTGPFADVICLQGTANLWPSYVQGGPWSNAGGRADGAQSAAVCTVTDRNSGTVWTLWDGDNSGYAQADCNALTLKGS